MNRVAIALMASILSTPGVAQSPERDVTFTMKITSDSGGQSKSTTERFLASGAKVRMEIGTLPATAALGGMFMIVNRADSTMMSVMPSLQSAMIMRMPAMDGSLASAMSISRATAGNRVDLGPAETILGYPTRHYRIHASATITTTLPDKVCTQTRSGVRDTWVTTDTEPGAILKAVMQSLSFGSSPLPGKSWMDIADSVAGAPPGPMPLRTVSRDSVTESDGQITEKTTTIEYTELSRAALDSTLFAIPAGFQVNDMRSMALPDLASGIATMAASITAKATGCRPKSAP